MAVRVLWRRYLDVLEKRPLATQMVQTGALMGLGDIIAQGINVKRNDQSFKSSYQVEGTVRFVGMGLFLVAPCIRVWYVTLEKIVGNKLGSPLKNALAKMTLDQTAFAPIFLATFISTIGLTQGQPLAKVKEKLDEEWKDVVITNWKIWPMVQACNFYLTPVLLRPLVVSTVALFWNTYLSLKSNQS